MKNRGIKNNTLQKFKKKGRALLCVKYMTHFLYLTEKTIISAVLLLRISFNN